MRDWEKAIRKFSSEFPFYRRRLGNARGLIRCFSIARHSYSPNPTPRRLAYERVKSHFWKISLCSYSFFPAIRPALMQRMLNMKWHNSIFSLTPSLPYQGKTEYKPAGVAKFPLINDEFIEEVVNILRQIF